LVLMHGLRLTTGCGGRPDGRAGVCQVTALRAAAQKNGLAATVVGVISPRQGWGWLTRAALLKRPPQAATLPG